MLARLLLATWATAAALRPTTPPTRPQQHDVCCSTRRLLLPTALAAVLLPQQAHAAAEAVAGNCLGDCIRECNLVAPGNEGYCRNQCTDYCEENGAAYGKSDVLRTDVSELKSADGKQCSSYKTDAAQAYCKKQALAAAAPAPSPLAANNGIFGDSGVTYSKGVEDLLASAFGATRQAMPRSEANVDAYAGEILDKAKAAIVGK